MSTYERSANYLTLALFIALVSLSIVGALYISEPIPMHFNGNGQANHWGSSATLLILPLICGCIVGLFWAIRYIPTSLMNFPGPRTPENIASQRQNINQLMATLQVLVAGLFLSIVGQIMWISLHHQKQAIMWPSYIFIALFSISTLLYLIRAYRLSANH